MTNIAELAAKVELIRDAPEELWDIARARLLNIAPDLYEVVTGEPSTADVIAGLHATRETDQQVRLQRGLRGGRA